MRLLRLVWIAVDDGIAVVSLFVGLFATIFLLAATDLALSLLSTTLVSWVELGASIALISFGGGVGAAFYLWASRGFPGRGRVGSSSTLRERHARRALLEAAHLRLPIEDKNREAQVRALARAEFLSSAEGLAREHYGLNVLAANLAAYEALGTIERMAKNVDH